MAGTQRGLLLAILLVVAGVPASAKDYTVGGSSGWKPGVDYAAWAKGKPFSVGDTLCKHQCEARPHIQLHACAAKASSAIGAGSMFVRNLSAWLAGRAMDRTVHED
jgi:hypothetical protein